MNPVNYADCLSFFVCDQSSSVRLCIQDYKSMWSDYDNCSILVAVQKLKRNSSGDKIANVNFLYDDIVHVLQNTIDSCINSAIDRRGYVLERMFTKFSEITQCNGHYAVQGHSRSPILAPIESSYTTSY